MVFKEDQLCAGMVTQNGQQDWTSNMPPSSKRQLTPTTNPPIRKQLAAEKLKTEFIQDVIYHIDKECGTDLGKKSIPSTFQRLANQTGLNVSRYCQWLESPTSLLSSRKTCSNDCTTTEQILELVMEYRCLMPSIGTRKLYWLIKGKLLQRGLKVWTDQLFKILKEHNLLIRPKRRYTKLRIASIG